jgi:hypothetical protein
MKTINFLSAAAILAATVMTSCSKSNEDANSNDRVEVKFASAQASVETRVTDTDWAQDDPIGIYMIKATPGTLTSATDILEGVSNRNYKASAGGATASFEQVDGTIYYPADDQNGKVEVKFIAYHPYGTVSDNATSFVRAIDVSDQTDQSAIDFLYAPAAATYNKSSGAVTLPFAHKLVKLVFSIGNDVSVTASLDDLKVEITDQETASTLDLTDGSVPVSTGGAETITALTALDGASSEAIVLPNSNITSDMKFVFTNAAGEVFTGVIPDSEWEAGKKYTYSVTLKKNEAVITGTITAWGDGNGSTGSVVAD